MSSISGNIFMVIHFQKSTKTEVWIGSAVYKAYRMVYEYLQYVYIATCLISCGVLYNVYYKAEHCVSY